MYRSASTQLRRVERVNVQRTRRLTVLSGSVSDDRADRVAPTDAAATTYVSEICESGLTLCRDISHDIQPQDLAARLQTIGPGYMIVDAHKLDIQDLRLLDNPDYLCDWLAPDAAAEASPILLAFAEAPGWPAIMAQAWGLDAVVSLFTRMRKEDLLTHLRRCARVASAQKGGEDGLLGICWPSVLVFLLMHGSSDLTEQLMTDIEAVLVELPDLPEGWLVFGQDNITTSLNSLGFVRGQFDA